MEREEYMRAALGLAREAAADGEVPVGCVIADSAGQIIGRGRNRRERTHRADAHAEMEAIAQACQARGTWRLDGCTLYVTLEPCPMCAGAIINARVPAVVYGAKEPNFGSCGSVLNLFEERYGHHPAIYGGVLALSDFIREDYLKTSTLDPQRAYILHNCIDTSRFCPGPASKALRAQLGFTDADFIVLYCGRLDPDKGIHKLMEAIAALPIPQIKLLIVGSPFFARTQQSPFQRRLEQQAKSLGSRVQFTGYIPNEDLPDYYRLADLCCVPTLVEEAAGLVAVEAMACGRPVLATRSGGMPEYLQGSQAVLVERGDTVADQLAWSIRMLYEHPALCAEMGAAGALRGKEFSTEHYYAEFVRIVRDMIETGGAL